MAPRDLPDPPKEPQEGPNSAPREPQGSPKGAPRGTTGTPKATTAGMLRTSCCSGMGWWGCAKREEFKYSRASPVSPLPPPIGIQSEYNRNCSRFAYPHQPIPKQQLLRSIPTVVVFGRASSYPRISPPAPPPSYLLVPPPCGRSGRRTRRRRRERRRWEARGR